MRHISFGWTWPALFAKPPLKKIVTRRSWKDSYAKQFKAGELYGAASKDFRAGGVKIGVIKLVEAPYLDPLSNMPDEDYYNEGFAYLNMYPSLCPESMPMEVSREGFDKWRYGGGEMWVVRFEPVELFDVGRDMIVELAASMSEKTASIY